jgi:hypothetical protein
MEISEQQYQAIAAGKPVELTIRGTHCILLRHDVYDRAQQSGAFSPREWYPAVIGVLDQTDTNPEQYLEYLDEQG